MFRPLVFLVFRFGANLAAIAFLGAAFMNMFVKDVDGLAVGGGSEAASAEASRPQPASVGQEEEKEKKENKHLKKSTGILLHNYVMQTFL